MEITTLSDLPFPGTGSLDSSRRKDIGWGITWLPAFTLLTSDLLSWPAIFLLLSPLRDVILGSEGQVGWHILVIPAVVSMIVLHVVSGYDRRTQMLSLGYTVEHILGLSIAFLISALILYGVVTFGHLVKPSRFTLFANFVVYAAYTLGLRRWLSAALQNHHSHRHFLFIGDSEVAVSFSERYRRHQTPQELKIYAVDERLKGLPVVDEAGVCFVGKVDEALAGLNNECDGVIVGIHPSLLDRNLAQLLAYVQFRHIPVYTLESFYEVAWKQVPVQSIEAWWAFARESLLARDSIYDQIKRLCDLCAAFAALVILSPFLLLVGILIRLDNPGPAIFRQTRIGRYGRPFTLFKFRSMRIGSDRGSIYTAKNDSRVTRLGRFLRATRIDELPQLFNVLRGDMSLIGPRAEWIKCVELYESRIPFYSYRHFVRPGITGWAQVNYPYGESEADAIEKLRFDLYYIRNFSLSLDMAIVLKTLYTILFAKGR
jgi:exopolysaccharide biosynthesis polyprenyl glycosylphosphotransferase